MKKAFEYIRPVLVLMLICLFISAALAVTNEKTAPIIEAAENAKAENARKDALPAADGFTLMQLSDLPATVKEVYKANNGEGFVFTLVAKGYGGNMKTSCGIDKNGLLTACSTLSHGETKGLGSKTADLPFREQFAGKDAYLTGVDTISGATVSSKAYIGAIKDAFTAYEIAKEAE